MTAGRKKASRAIPDPSRLARLISAAHADPDFSAAGLPDRKAHVVGVTGSTAAGKSTLIDKIIGVVREDGLTVVVLAIDPTEEDSGGAILGDAIRMRDHYLDTGVFLRSFGSRGALSAVTLRLPQVIDVAARFADVVLVETAGAGQADTALRKIVDTFVTLADPRGDAITLLKAGHHRHAHILVANARTGSEDEERFFSLARSFVETLPSADGWKVPFFRVGALSGDGVPELVRQGLFAHRKSLGR